MNWLDAIDTLVNWAADPSLIDDVDPVKLITIKRAIRFAFHCHINNAEDPKSIVPGACGQIVFSFDHGNNVQSDVLINEDNGPIEHIIFNGNKVIDRETFHFPQEEPS